MSNLQLLALVAMSASKSRSELDPCEFYGIKDYVEKMITDPVSALKLLLKREAGIEWDGKKALWAFLIDEARTECLVERTHALFSENNIVVSKAYQYLKAHEQLKNLDHAPGSEVLQRIENARQIVIGSIVVKPENLEAELPPIEMEPVE